MPIRLFFVVVAFSCITHIIFRRIHSIGWRAHETRDVDEHIAKRKDSFHLPSSISNLLCLLFFRLSSSSPNQNCFSHIPNLIYCSRGSRANVCWPFCVLLYMQVHLNLVHHCIPISNVYTSYKYCIVWMNCDVNREVENESSFHYYYYLTIIRKKNTIYGHLPAFCISFAVFRVHQPAAFHV